MSDAPGSARDDADKSVEELEADIARTREQLSRTMDSITHQLHPDRFKEQTQDTLGVAQESVLKAVHELTDISLERAGGVGRGVVRTIQDHPLPSALVALGAAFWALAGDQSAAYLADKSRELKRRGQRLRSQAQSSPRRAPTSRRFSQAAPLSRGGSQAGVADTLRRGVAELGRRSTEVLSAAQERASKPLVPSVRLPVGRRQSSGYGEQRRPYGSPYRGPERTGSGAWRGQGSQDSRGISERAGEVVSGVQTQLTQRTKSVTEDVAELMEKQPLAVGVVTALLGVAVGVALPSSRTEDELLGDARGRVAERVQDVAQRAKEVAQKTFEEVKETALSELEGVKQEGQGATQGLVGRAQEAVQKVAADAAETAKKEADKQGLS